MKELDQLQKEWILLIALRELLSFISKKRSISHYDAIKLARTLAPEIFNESKIAVKLDERLQGIYNKSIGNSSTGAIDSDNMRVDNLIIRDKLSNLEMKLLEHSNLIKVNRFPDIVNKKSLFDDPEIVFDEAEMMLRQEIADLYAIMNYGNKEPPNLQTITENQAILNDAFLNRANKFLINNKIGKFSVYRDSENNSIFRVAILHPNPSETITGADLIYEQYDNSNEMVRIVAIQYKIWEGEKLYFSKSKNLESQIKKMGSCFCKNNFCDGEQLREINIPCPRPYCSAYLRPTNKFQEDNNLITMGYHLPICKIDDLKTERYKNYMLEFYKIRGDSIQTDIFEDLFHKGIVGSKWLKISVLEEFYRQTKILEPSQRIILYAQSMKF